MHKIKPKIHIWWTTREIDLDKRSTRFEYFRQFVLNARTQDVIELLNTPWMCKALRDVLWELEVPDYLKEIFSEYLNAQG